MIPQTLYHGSNQRFDAPSLEHAHDKRDFGTGFYTTTIKEQAQSWAYNVHQRFEGDGAFLYTFQFEQLKGLEILSFDSISLDWLDLVKNNRLHGGVQHGYDLVVGPVANDNTIRTVALYVEGIYDAEYAMKKLQHFRANDQISFHTERALKCLTLKDCEQFD